MASGDIGCRKGLLREAAIVIALALVTCFPPAARPATLPAGFSEVTIATGLTTPTAMAFAPDGRLFIAQQDGRLRVVRNATLLATPFVSLTVDARGERGLLGVAFDPNFAINGYVYVYYTATTPTIHNRVSRFTASGDVALAGSETVLLELNTLSSATNHNGGALHFGPDGKLYVAVGENATPSNAQTLANLLGKVLRINRDGSIPTDNPFYATASGVNRAIWAIGLRNPFTFAFQPSNGRMFINDVGQNAWEEIDEGAAGSNYGWPNSEGPTLNAGERGPLYYYGHGTGAFLGCAITGGTFYEPTTQPFPAAYRGSYFFADFCGDWINRYDPATNAVSTFASGIDAPVDVRVGPDGFLYYLARGNGTTTGFVRAIRYASGAASTTTTLASGANPSVAGAGVTFTATVTGTAPTGSVAFTMDGGTQIAGCGAVALAGSGNARTAQCVSSTFTIGTHSVVARYSGDAGNASSVSSPLTQLVNPPPAGYANVALASAGGVASASTAATGYPAAAMNNGDRTGADTAGGRWKDATADAYPDWAQIRFAGARTIDRVVVYTVQDNYQQPVEPTDMMRSTLYGLSDFTVQSWNGTAWTVVATVTGNSLIKRTVLFPAVTTDRVRVQVTSARASHSRITEIEAWGTSPPTTASVNVALATAGGVASASSVAAGYPVAAINNADRTGADAAGGRWKDATADAYPDWAAVTFNGTRTIDRVVVYSVQDDYINPVQPTDTMTTSLYGLLDFTVQGWNGSAWVVLGTVTGNNLVKRTVTFARFATDRIRVNVTRGRAGYSRIVELEAWTAN